jgi:hypothetical protein
MACCYDKVDCAEALVRGSAPSWTGCDVDAQNASGATGAQLARDADSTAVTARLAELGVTAKIENIIGLHERKRRIERSIGATVAEMGGTPGDRPAGIRDDARRKRPAAAAAAGPAKEPGHRGRRRGPDVAEVRSPGAPGV